MEQRRTDSQPNRASPSLEGTGGSPGVDYLDQTLQYRIFTDLWSVRTLLVPRAALPALGNPAFYGFAT